MHTVFRLLGFVADRRGTITANILSVVGNEIVRFPAEEAARHVFTKNDRISVNMNFQPIALGNIKCVTDLFRDYDSAQ